MDTLQNLSPKLLLAATALLTFLAPPYTPLKKRSQTSGEKENFFLLFPSTITICQKQLIIAILVKSR